MRHLPRECRRRWEHVGSGRRAACHRQGLHHHRSRPRSGPCGLPSGRRSRSCAPRGTACGRSPLERAASTISRELRRNAATRGGGLEYRATTAQWHADRSARQPAKLAVNAALRAGAARRYDRRADRVGGPAVMWKGRRSGRRQDRRWATAWSPEQIARRLRLDFPDDQTMRISHEAIYQALYLPGRGALRRELTACLRTGRALRVPRARTRRRGKSFVTPEIMISARRRRPIGRCRATGRAT